MIYLSGVDQIVVLPIRGHALDAIDLFRRLSLDILGMDMGRQEAAELFELFLNVLILASLG